MHMYVSLKTWSVDTYQLWLLPKGEHLFDQSSYHHSNKDHPSPTASDHPTDIKNKVLVAGSHVVVINFVKSAFINNPVIVSTCMYMRPLKKYIILHVFIYL